MVDYKRNVDCRAGEAGQEYTRRFSGRYQVRLPAPGTLPSPSRAQATQCDRHAAKKLRSQSLGAPLARNCRSKEQHLKLWTSGGDSCAEPIRIVYFAKNRSIYVDQGDDRYKRYDPSKRSAFMAKRRWHALRAVVLALRQPITALNQKLADQVGDFDVIVCGGDSAPSGV